MTRTPLSSPCVPVSECSIVHPFAFLYENETRNSLGMKFKCSRFSLNKKDSWNNFVAQLQSFRKSQRHKDVRTIRRFIPRSQQSLTAQTDKRPRGLETALKSADIELTFVRWTETRLRMTGLLDNFKVRQHWIHSSFCCLVLVVRFNVTISNYVQEVPVR